jgi:hypothetical protein
VFAKDKSSRWVILSAKPGFTPAKTFNHEDIIVSEYIPKARITSGLIENNNGKQEYEWC